jgi:hypothetical protein
MRKPVTWYLRETYVEITVGVYVYGYFSGIVVRNPETLHPGNGTATRCSTG